MNVEFVTWQTLLTAAGATLTTGIVVQLLKAYVKIPAQLFAYIVALITLITATIFTGGGISEISICIFNAFLVASAASNTVAAYNRMRK